jgi:hypothetical protein
MATADPVDATSGQLAHPQSAAENHDLLALSTEQPIPATSSKLTRHHRKNSTVQEQRALRVKAAEMERAMSLPRVRL